MGAVGPTEQGMTAVVDLTQPDPAPAAPTTAPGDAGGRSGGAIARRVAWGVVRSLGTFVLVTALLLSLWIGFLEVFDVNSYVGKTPTQVWDWVTDPVAGAERRDELWEATKETLVESGLGFVTGLAAAVVAAVAFVLSRPLERAVMPIALALRSVPIVAMVPLLAYIFGRELVGSLVIVSIIVWFPALVLVANGLRSVRPEALDLLRAYDAGPFAQLVKVRLPSAIPSLVASAKVCAPLAILGSLLNGWLSTGTGLGALMSLSTITAEFAKLWAAVVIVTVVSVLFAAVVSALEQVTLARWAPERLAR
jgi:ABC-type nitrate/sulfonate/bicarbonate transport system permease component